MRYEPEHIYFDFHYLPDAGITHCEMSKYSRWISNNFAKTYGNKWNKQSNVEWIIRTYKSAKMVMATTLMLNTAQYCIERNALITVPYLLYYALFNAARALVFVEPHQKWDDVVKLFEISHKNLSALTKDVIARLNKDLSEKFVEILSFARNERELFSYSFPANGQGNEFRFDEIVEICGAVVEIAELTGFRVQSYIEKHFLSTAELREEAMGTWANITTKDLQSGYTYNRGKSSELLDNEDWYRIDRIRRKVKAPMSILFTLAEGMTEDFFGAWLAETIDEEQDFSPYANWGIIFPIP